MKLNILIIFIGLCFASLPAFAVPDSSSKRVYEASKKKKMIKKYPINFGRDRSYRTHGPYRAPGQLIIKQPKASQNGPK